MEYKYCYYCGKNATSSEHVPPKCLFPEEKDLEEGGYRQNLITVPSCDLHNQTKSNDDEFLMASLVPIVGNNGLGYLHAQTKLYRAINRKPRLLDDVVANHKPNSLRIVDEGQTYNFPVLLGSPDLPRLARCFEAIARGLYFYENSTQFSGLVKSIPNFVKFPEGSDAEHIQSTTIKLCIKERKKWPVQGANPKIFKYQIGDIEDNGIISMILTFYQNAEAMIALVPDEGS